MAATTTKHQIIDSHLHIWANRDESTVYPYVQEPPEALQDVASTSALLEQMKQNGVDGALIVQPINHKFDHSYVIQAIQRHPQQLKEMLLYDPTTGVDRLEELVLRGFVGVRFNPYLWPKLSESSWKSMTTSMDVYKRCGELSVPVGIMCFQGLNLHYDDIVAFLKESPKTMMILDHFGFTSIDDEASFNQLLSLAQYPSAHVKISALFRLKDVHPYDAVYEKRFLPLVRAFGAERLLFGSDFPYCLEQTEKYTYHKLVSKWCPDEESRQAILGGNSERLFGPWK